MKMRKLTFFIPFMMLTVFSFGQYQLGHRVVTFTDPSRSDREIETHLYYPAATAGDDVPVASGTFPVVVMGHGSSWAILLYTLIFGVVLPQRVTLWHFYN